jgi:flagellar basal body-associated protein FliL
MVDKSAADKKRKRSLWIPVLDYGVPLAAAGLGLYGLRRLGKSIWKDKRLAQLAKEKAGDAAAAAKREAYKAKEIFMGKRKKS